MNATILRKNRAALQAMGWKVEFIPGKGHEVGLEPELVVPLVIDFLDQAFADQIPE